MRKLPFAIALLSLPLLLTAISACGDDEGSGVDYTANADCTAVNASTNTYTAVIKPILDGAGCAAGGCHDAVTASQGIDLSDYAGAKNAFDKKDALCAIHHGSGCEPMPKGGSQLPDAVINLIDCWAKNGYAQ